MSLQFTCIFAALVLFVQVSGGCVSQWSNWKISVACPDSCGGGFNATFVRTCVNASACPCTGPSEISRACNQNVCKYPRHSCVGDLKSLPSNGEVICTTAAAVNQTDAYPDLYSCCPPQGIWGSWSEAACNGTCGGYGIGFRKRSCLSAPAGCPCIGDATQSDAPCNLVPCSDKAPCASGLTMNIEGGIIVCVKTPTPIKPSTCCPPFGTWENWGAWSSCSSTCGGCAQASRTRTCASEKYGCPCDNSTTTDTQPCNRNACPTGSQCCAPLVPLTLSNGEILCLSSDVSTGTTTAAPTTTVPSTAVWAEWTLTCTANCGLCGKVVRNRVCKSGTCIGDTQMNTTQTCGGPSLCPFGLGFPSCCSPSTQSVVGGEFKCVLSPA